jgi:glycosyltransferase involved in cell wall biosynthesis
LPGTKQIESTTVLAVGLHFMKMAKNVFSMLFLLISKGFRPILIRHPGLYRFACHIKAASKELLYPSETSYDPICTHSIQPLAVQTSPLTDQLKSVESLPQWLIREWQSIHEIEPMLFPNSGEEMVVTRDGLNPVAEIYASLSGQVEKNVTHIILVPWLDRGGADLVAINYMKSIFHNDADLHVVVIATANAESPWASKLPEQATFIEFGKVASQLSYDDQTTLLVRLLLQSSPGVIHNINSRLGYDVFVRFGVALSHASRLYMSIFCSDFTPEGRAIGYATEYLPRIFDHMTAVTVDNATFLEKMAHLYALDRNKMHLQYQPVHLFPQRDCCKSEKVGLDILWAGRIDYQKRPDILLEIIRASSEYPFRFHIYGTSVLNRDVSIDKLASCENAHYYGVFDGLASLPIETFDVFLYTSQWDGLPTILLDAISLYLPVVASKVGGIGELIISGYTGFAVDPFNDVNRYVDILVEIFRNNNVLRPIADAAYQLVSQRHSWACFDARVRSLPGYLP